VAAALARQCGRVVVDDTGVAALAARARVRSELPHDAQARIDRRRDHAAPGSLREAVVAAASREGVTVEVVPAAGLSRTHARCGHQNPADDRYLSRTVVCDGCGARYDPNRSATVLMLRAALGRQRTSAMH
jgi:transposase